MPADPSILIAVVIIVVVVGFFRAVIQTPCAGLFVHPFEDLSLDLSDYAARE